MAQHLADLEKARTIAEHFCCRCMTKAVWANRRQTGTYTGESDDALDGSNRQPANGCARSQEQPSALSPRTAVAEVVAHRLADVDRKRQLLLTPRSEERRVGKECR